jgi:hypothetical protein
MPYPAQGGWAEAVRKRARVRTYSPSIEAAVRCVSFEDGTPGVRNLVSMCITHLI